MADPVPDRLIEVLSGWEPAFEIVGTGAEREPWGQWDDQYDASAGVSGLYFPDHDLMVMDNRQIVHHNGQWNVLVNRMLDGPFPSPVMPFTIDTVGSGWRVEMARSHGGLYQALGKHDALGKVTQITSGSQVEPRWVWDVVYAARRADIPGGIMQYTFRQPGASVEDAFAPDLETKLQDLYREMRFEDALPEPAIDRTALAGGVERDAGDDPVPLQGVERGQETLRQVLEDRKVAGIDFPWRKDCADVWADETGLADFDREIKDGGIDMAWAVVCVTPLNWLRLQAAQSVARGFDVTAESFLSRLGPAESTSVRRMMRVLNQGRDEIPTPLLELGLDGTFTGFQEGRKRGVAAYLAGLDRFPVLVFVNTATEGEGPMQDVPSEFELAAKLEDFEKQGIVSQSVAALEAEGFTNVSAKELGSMTAIDYVTDHPAPNMTTRGLHPSSFIIDSEGVVETWLIRFPTIEIDANTTPRDVWDALGGALESERIAGRPYVEAQAETMNPHIEAQEMETWDDPLGLIDSLGTMKDLYYDAIVDEGIAEVVEEAEEAVEAVVDPISHAGDPSLHTQVEGLADEPPAVLRLAAELRKLGATAIDVAPGMRGSRLVEFRTPLPGKQVIRSSASVLDGDVRNATLRLGDLQETTPHPSNDPEMTERLARVVRDADPPDDVTLIVHFGNPSNIPRPHAVLGRQPDEIVGSADRTVQRGGEELSAEALPGFLERLMPLVRDEFEEEFVTNG